MAELLHFTIVEARIDGDALGELEAIRAEAIVNAPSVTSALLTTLVHRDTCEMHKFVIDSLLARQSSVSSADAAVGHVVGKSKPPDASVLNPVWNAMFAVPLDEHRTAIVISLVGLTGTEAQSTLGYAEIWSASPLLRAKSGPRLPGDCMPVRAGLRAHKDGLCAGRTRSASRPTSASTGMLTSATSGSRSRGMPPGPHLRQDRRSGRRARAKWDLPSHARVGCRVGEDAAASAPHGTALVPRRSRGRCVRGEARCAAYGLRCNAGASGKQKLGAVRLRAALKPLAGAAAKSTCISYQARRRDSHASLLAPPNRKGIKL